MRAANSPTTNSRNSASTQLCIFSPGKRRGVKRLLNRGSSRMQQWELINVTGNIFNPRQNDGSIWVFASNTFLQTETPYGALWARQVEHFMTPYKRRPPIKGRGRPTMRPRARTEGGKKWAPNSLRKRVVHVCPGFSLCPKVPPGAYASLCYLLDSSNNGYGAIRPGGGKCSNENGHDIRPTRRDPPESWILHRSKQAYSASRNQIAARGQRA